MFSNDFLEFTPSNDSITLTFSVKWMLLRKITIENTLKYIPSTISSPSEVSHDHKSKTVSNPRKQNEKLPQNDKKSLKII